MKAGFYSPPLKPVFTTDDKQEMIKAVNDFQPDVFFIRMIAQTKKWIHENKELIQAKVMCSIVAVFDFYAGTVDRPKKIRIDMSLE